MDKIITNIMRYKENGEWVRIESPTTEQILKGIQSISPGAVFVVQGDQLISRLIGFWGLISNLWRAIKYGFRVWASHVGNYWGSGSHKTIEAKAQGVVEGNFLEYLDKHHQVKVWYNKDLTVENMQIAKSWDYAQVGKKYDYKAFLNFVFDKVSEEKDAFICSEIVSDKVKLYKVPYLIKESFRIQPIEVVEFMDQRKGGWEPCFQWNWEG